MVAARQHGDAPRSWADLPLVLAAAVLRCLPSRPLDRVRFGAVCPQWRAAARENPAMPPHFPWLALPNRTFYSLPDSAFRLLPAHLDGHRQLPHAQTACGEWLVFERQDGNITLMSPFSGAAAMVLPGLHTLRPNDEPFKIAYDVQGPAIKKLVVCSGNLVAAAVVDKAYVIKLALCRPGAASWSWALVGGANVKVHDIVLYQGRLYAFGHDGSLSAVSISTAADEDPDVSSVDRVIAGLEGVPRPGNPCYLLESGGALLMVTQCNAMSLSPAAAAEFVVYVASFELSRWTMARSSSQLEAVLPDRALFVGPWCSRSVAVAVDQRGSVGAGSVVFFSYECLAVGRFVYRKRLPFCCGVFDLKTRRLQPSLLQLFVKPLKGFRATWLFLRTSWWHELNSSASVLVLLGSAPRSPLLLVIKFTELLRVRVYTYVTSGCSA